MFFIYNENISLLYTYISIHIFIYIYHFIYKYRIYISFRNIFTTLMEEKTEQRDR